MFKKDEYIICLNTPISDIDFPPNYIFKQAREAEHISVYQDACGDQNGWKQVKFDNSSDYSDWRYATPEEIEEYERLGKPYDVTTLKQFKVPKKWWLKVITNEEDKVLTDYCNQKFNTQTGPVDSTLTQPIFYYSEKIGDICWTVGNNKADKSFIEITYSQFLKYVLNQKEIKENMEYLIPFINQLNE